MRTKQTNDIHEARSINEEKLREPEELSHQEQAKIQEQYEEGLDLIEASQAGVYIHPKKTEGIMSLRWESKRLLQDLWKLLTGRYVYTNNKGTYLAKKKDEEPGLLNDYGAKKIIGVVESFINPVVSLAKISFEEAQVILRQTMKGIRTAIVLEEKRFGCENRTSKVLIMTKLRPLIWAQLSRAIGGHESKYSVTQIQEQRAQSNINEHVTTGKPRGYGRDDFAGGVKPWA